MATITPVTDSVGAELPDSPSDPAERASEAAQPSAPGVAAGGSDLRRLLDILDAAQRNGRDVPASEQAAVETRTRRRPAGVMQAALAAALITGLLGLAAVGFSALNSNINTLNSNINALRTDVDADIGALDAKIDTLRSDMNARFAQVDARFVQIDERFARMDERFDALSLTLLDHTDRLARIEAIHSTHPHTHAQQPDAQQQE